MQEKVFSYMEKHHMLQPGDRVVAGISGGADSVCLLFLLLEWAKEHPLSLSVVHVDHGIRREAGEDAAYVERLCREYDIPFNLVEADVHGLAKREHCSEEEAGRRLRYEAFARVAGEQGAGKIAVAHNLNDRSETMLFHLFRGSGIKGLCSISPVRGEIIRPLLCLERGEIEQYLQGRGISWQEDVTNAGDDYTRNRIRHHIMPYAEQEICAGAARHMAQTADLLTEVEDYLAEQTVEALESCLVRRIANQRGKMAGYELDAVSFGKHHPVLQKRMLLRLVQQLTPSGKDIGAIHIRDLQELFEREGNRSIQLPFSIQGRRSYGSVYLEREMECEMPEKDFVLEYAKFSYEKNQEVPQNQYTKWFDCDKIEKSLMLRTRQTGDYLTIADGQGGYRHKSLKDYMIDRKIPKEQREQIPVLAEGQHVLWLVGYRISEYYKISKNTKHVLQVQLKRRSCESNGTEEKNGRTC